MISRQFLIEFKRSFTHKNLLKWLGIILLLPLISFLPVSTGYLYFQPVDVFQETVGFIIPMLFPVLVVFIYLPSFLQEQKNHFITYTRTRVPLNYYILVKGLMNALLTGFIILSMMFFTFIFVTFIEPNFIQIVDYSPPLPGDHEVNVTFSQFLEYGTWTYVLVYSLWVTLNAIVYSTISFLLMIILKKSFVAISVPFLFYHVFNFVSGVFGIAQFSPLSTVFPFNIEQQELWTVFVPLGILLLCISILYLIVIRNKEDWMI
ncbi:ABC transporter permease [Terribacillus saccharophilus]|uniref:ABC transporter permease n=1 Tax=Terribacillus saccharophilus TaxID=361277 RepID=UPI000BA5CDF9|nr:ABC transporter permease [Terribacillus saccharophilus]PAF36232.1 ABC transporter permease [Terribacillus saccharophilus]